MYNKIATYIEDILGGKFRIGYSNDVSIGKVLDNQTVGILRFGNTIQGMQQGEFSMINDFTLSFMVKTSIIDEVYEALDNLTKNYHQHEFTLLDVPYKFMIYFNGQTVAGSLTVINGDDYQQINIIGQIAMTENLIQSNTIEIEINYQDKTMKLNGVVNYTDSMENIMENEVLNTDENSSLSILSNGNLRSFIINFACLVGNEAQAFLFDIYNNKQNRDTVFNLKIKWVPFIDIEIKVKLKTMTLSLVNGTFGQAQANFLEHKDVK